MRSLKVSIFSALLVAAATVVSADNARAVQAYTYTGNFFDVLKDSADIPGAFDTSMRVTGYLVLQTPIGPSSVFGGRPIEYAFSDGRFTITRANAANPFTVFLVTDSTGNIINWSFFFTTFRQGQRIPDGVTFHGIFSLFSEPSVVGGGIFQKEERGEVFTSTAEDQAIIGDNTPIGTWSIGRPAAATATPLPTSLPLLAGGLGVIGLLARKRKRGRA